MRGRLAWDWLATLSGAAVFAYLVTRADWWEAALSALFPGQDDVLYPRGTPLSFTLEHLALVGVAAGVTVGVGFLAGVWVTRPSGADFRELVAAATDIGQTFPPLALLALAMPVLGFGFWPTVVALVVYGLFPVVSNTVAGIDAVPPAVLEAARGMGMSPFQTLVRVELPLATRVILAGVRTSVIIVVGTATIGAAIGAGGLGDPIIGGLVRQNMAYVVEGAVPVAVLAILLDRALASIEATFAASRGRPG